MDETEKALKELLKLLADHPELADRITITLKPGKLIQSRPPEKPKK